MRVRYDAKTKTLEFKDGSKEEFYCGGALDNLSLILLDYKDGYLTTQQAYSEFLKLIVTPLELPDTLVRRQTFNGGIALYNNKEV